MNRLVQLSVNTPSPSSELKVRVYYPVSLLTGPDLQVCRTYDEYLDFYGEDSFAQLLFSWNYELLCHRISYVYSKANLTKYLVDGEYKYFMDSGRYYQSPTLIEPKGKVRTHHNSFLITINNNAESYNDFYVIFRSRMKDVVSELVFDYSIGLFGCDYIANCGNGVYDDGKDYIKSHFNLEPLSRSVFLPLFTLDPQAGYRDAHLDVDSFEVALKDYLVSSGFIVESLGYHRLLVSSVSEDVSYSLFSDVVSVEELEDHYDRYYASIYKNHRILSISSSYKSAYSNIVVNIEKLDTKSYSVHVSKSSGDWVNEEYFIVDPYALQSTDTVRTFSEINKLSKYIQIETFMDYDSEDFDPTGTYTLKGDLGFNDENLYMNKLSSLTNIVIEGYYMNNTFYEDENHTIPIEPSTKVVYEDLSTFLYYVWDGSKYLTIDYYEADVPQVDAALPLDGNNDIAKELHLVFPQAMIITAPGDPVQNGIRVNPDNVYWYSYGREIPSGFAVLYSLLTTSYFNDARLFRLPINKELVPEDKYDLNIQQTEYGVEIKSIYVYRSSKDLNYSNRAFLARAMVYRICLDISQTSMQEIHDYIESNCSQIANLFHLNLTYRLENESQIGRSYKADLMILVDNRLFTRFEIYTELNYEG